MGRWAPDTLQCRLNQRILPQHQMKWDRGWLQYRAQEETAKLWLREGDRWQSSVRWHIQVRERNAGRAVPAPVQQARTLTVGLEGPAEDVGLLWSASAPLLRLKHIPIPILSRNVLYEGRFVRQTPGQDLHEGP